LRFIGYYHKNDQKLIEVISCVTLDLLEYESKIDIIPDILVAFGNSNIKKLNYVKLIIDELNSSRERINNYYYNTRLINLSYLCTISISRFIKN
jgi:hypothetical protein